MAVINIIDVDETRVKVSAERSQMMELKDAFSFLQPGYQFSPKYKSGYWDGRISMINMRDGMVYKGLIPLIQEFCDNRKYTLNIEDSIFDGYGHYGIDHEKINQLYHNLKAPYQPHLAQLKTVEFCINNDRSIILAPTNNGKSYAIHGVVSFYAKLRKKVLVIIDRTQLVNQLRNNLAVEYKGDQLFSYETVYTTSDKKFIDSDVYFTTWHSCYQNDAKWFKQFDVLIGDEVHKFKAESLKLIMDKCTHIRYRHGFTATLDNDSKINRFTLIGMFGNTCRVSTTKEDIENGISAKPIIYAILREYSPQAKKLIKQQYGVKVPSGYKLTYQSEVAFLEGSDERNQFISKLESQLGGNTLIAFKRDDHGTRITNLLKERYVDGSKPIFKINHTVKIGRREEISEIISSLKQSTTVASVGTFGTGVNIKNINNIIIAVQMESSIDVLQMIGRGIRLAEGKTTVNIYDIGDDLSTSSKPNDTLRHFKQRLKYYSNEGHEIKLITYKVNYFSNQERSDLV